MRLEGITLAPPPRGGRGAMDDYCSTPSITAGLPVSEGAVPM
jgi:hypothetical protein